MALDLMSLHLFLQGGAFSFGSAAEGARRLRRRQTLDQISEASGRGQTRQSDQMQAGQVGTQQF
jgi:hypothetical protein